MARLVALKTRKFGVQYARAGETFTASRQYARIWKALGLAADASAVQQASAAIEPKQKPKQENAIPQDPDLASRTKAELLEIAGGYGIEVSTRATKAEIIAAIEAHLKASASEE